MKQFFSVLFLAIFSLFLISPVNAQAPSMEVAPPIPTFAADSMVSLAENYPGAVFAAGGQVEFSGTTRQDLVVAGGSVRVSGTVGQDLYAAGGSVVISGTVNGNVVVAGGEVQLLEGSRVNGNVISAGEHVALLGTILGQVNSGSDELALGNTTRITGDLNATTDEVQNLEHASVSGQRNVSEPEEKSPADTGPTDEILGALYSWLWGFALAALLIKLRPRIVQRSVSLLKENVGGTALTGIFWLTGVPLLALFLLITVIGIPLAIILGLLYGIVLLIAWVWPTLYLGQRFLPQQNTWIQAAVAVLAVVLLGEIPVIGWVFQLALTVIGAGVLWKLSREVDTASGKKKK